MGGKKAKMNQGLEGLVKRSQYWATGSRGIPDSNRTFSIPGGGGGVGGGGGGGGGGGRGGVWGGGVGGGGGGGWGGGYLPLPVVKPERKGEEKETQLIKTDFRRSIMEGEPSKS